MSRIGALPVWSAGAVLPLFLREAMLRTPVVESMVLDPKAPV